MSGGQLRTILWLRWRLTRNQWAKGGGLGAVLALVLGLGGVGLGLAGFAGGLAGGYLGLHGASKAAVMGTWLALSVMFLFSWLIATLVDLQRSEVIDLPRLMRLPISLGWAFLVNYVASLMGVTIALFAPTMLGLALGLALDRGPAMLLLVPLSMGLVFMVTAWTYLFQGWIATWVQNPRRRRALIAAIGISVALLAQLPNLVFNVMLRSSPQEDAAQTAGVPGFACGAQTCRADQACVLSCCGQSVQWTYRYAPELGLTTDDQSTCSPCPSTDAPACVDARDAIRARKRQQAEEKRWDRLVDKLTLAEKVVPPLWLAGGAGGLAEGDPLIALLGVLGFAALGAFGLVRGYRSTLRFYAGGEVSGAHAAQARPPGPETSAPGKRRLVERRIPGVHDQTAAVAVTTLQTILRAPEILMGLGFSFVMLPMAFVMLGASFRMRVEPGSHLGPLVVMGAMSLVVLPLAQLQNNQFGYDRDAFRALLLAPIARRRLLLGKNLALILLSGPMCSAALVASALWVHLPPLAVVAAALQMVTMLLVVAMLGNLLSILVPYRIHPGAMKATKLPPGALLATLGNVFAFPVLYAPAFAGPLAVLFAHHAHWRHPVLVDLAISLVMTAVVVGAHAASIVPLERLLQRRETTILGRVTVEHE